MNDSVTMTVKGLMLDPVSNSPIVVLKDEEEKIFLPIWVGIFEANAIALRIEQVDTPRPMTHDLLQDAIRSLGSTVDYIEITDLQDSTFFAAIHLHREGGDLVLDARPSDAIALALRSDAPIRVSRKVLDQAQTIALDENQEERLRKWLEEVSPEELGKYKM